ncbi:MAG: HlyD family efflux transporter periplasmic adaptor subunit [Clostridia bacterium]|nr:HlyD family efflux transporter periplasmic adaptor subunit [Clostridia bacterium]
MKTGRTILLALCAALQIASATAQTASVTKGSLTDTVYGSGTVQPVSQPGIYASADGRVAERLAQMGDRVSRGDILLRLEDDTLDAQIAQLEYELQLALDAVEDVETHSQYKYVQLRDDGGELRYDVNTGEPLMGKYSNEIAIRAPGDGRIMAIEIKPGDDALAVYREKGSVMMLSTDGRMKVELESIGCDGLALNDAVTVSGEGFEAEGRIVSLTRRGTQAVIQVMGDEYPMDAPVTVVKEDGRVIGEGVLAINKPLAVSAYGGRIKGIEYGVEVGAYVRREDVLARIEWDDIPLYLDNDSALRSYAVALAEWEAAVEKRDSLVVVAPCDGQVVSLDADVGGSVTAGSRLGSIVGDDGMTVMLTVDEMDIVRVQPGQRVSMTADALPDVQLTGSVLKIAPIGHTETAVTTYDVYVSLDTQDERVRGGMNVSGEIAVSTVSGALLIPTDTLRKDSGGYYVTMESGDIRRVTTGAMTDSLTQVLTGLSEGEKIAY